VSDHEAIDYAVDGTTAVITLDRPDDLNTIVPPMLEELEAAVTTAIRDPEVKVILLQGAGRSFCGGFNFGEGFRYWDDDIATEGAWDAGRDGRSLVRAPDTSVVYTFSGDSLAWLSGTLV